MKVQAPPAPNLWVCLRCGAWAPCIKGTIRPSGRLCNDELRRAKRAAHDIFDPIWRSGAMTRTEAYALLAAMMGLSAADCHFRLFDAARTAEAARCAALIRDTLPAPL